MGDMQAAKYTQIAINGDRFLLASDVDLTALKKRIERAAHADGRFVDFTTTDGHSMSALISSRSAVTIASYTVTSAPFEPDELAELNGLLVL